MATLHPMLTTAIRAARRAASIINRAALDLESGGTSLLEVTLKRRNDFVTQVDRAAEAAIIEIIGKAYPDHAILAEESGRSGRAGSEYVWIIDPLDGTTNFIHGFPQYAVSIALQHRGQVTQACVFDPNRNEMFTASKGRGAFLNDKRIRVSRRDRMDESLIGTGFPFRDGQNLGEYLAQFHSLTQVTAGIRRPGAATLDLCYVACGRLDGFWESGLAAWDMAAASLMIVEAGGLVADFKGDADYLAAGEIVAGTPKIFPQILQIIQKHHWRGERPASEPAAG